MQALYVGADTHTGRRPNNEDAYCVDPECGLFVVADGMGGEAGGEVASRIAVEVIRQFFRSNQHGAAATWPFMPEPGRSDAEHKVDIAVRLADRAVKSQREGELEKMGATLAVAAFEDGDLVIGHMGDSRVYRLRDGTFEQLTRDHSLYNKFRDSGASLPPREKFPYNNVVTRALGYGNDDSGSSPELQRHSPLPGDTYLLCSDGLTSVVSDERIAELLVEQPVQSVTGHLIREAYEQGSSDNITAVSVEVRDETAERSDGASTREPAPTRRMSTLG